MSEPLVIDIVSDVVCPWCYVGKKHIEKALANMPDIDAVVRWHPFQLDPSIPAEGYDRKAYMAKKFGDGGQLKAAHERLEALGNSNGIAFQFDAISRSPNTLDAHRLIRWADEAGVQDAVVSSLFQSYFEEGLDIGDRSVLAFIAGKAGMDSDLVTARLETDMDVESVRAEIAEAGRIGVSGVPFFILAQKLAVSGAQPSEVLMDAIRQAMAA
ncbi:MAG: DsbA family oxidoreductase [Alphaproteobacteria bacterium]|nr:DsbA family oxidoreductase [Alphaproteobacteria bacterium]